MQPNLREFVVVGWQRKPNDINSTRTSMKPMRIKDVSELAAIKAYARSNGVPEKLWNNGSAKPPIVIRAELKRGK